jgi:hypothetical protein
MAKKVKKKIHKRVNKKNWFEKLFTFTNIVIISAIILSAVTFYQITKPTVEVQGASTVSR